MTQQDYEFMKPFMLAQDYITQFKTLDNTSEVTHNLDRFRPAFVGHPGNYVDCYANEFGITDPKVQEALRNTAWLTVPNPRPIAGKPYVINRTARWLPTDTRDTWDQWRFEGVEKESVFVGLPEEYKAFKQFSGWDIEYVQTNNMLELAEVIAGAGQFVGNQSVALSMAIGLGVDWVCEQRKDLPMERNECYFPLHPRGDYF
jgi:ADP-heptose:LPS heptosyltransferase